MLTTEEQNAVGVCGENEPYNIEPIIQVTRRMPYCRCFNKVIISKHKLHPIATKKFLRIHLTESSIAGVHYKINM